MSKPPRITPLLSALSFLISHAALAGDWTQFRGSEGQGQSSARNLPLTWTHDPNGASTNITWRRPIPGSGWSSPILHNNRLYLTTAVSGEGNAQLSLRALCLRADNGEPVWEKELFAPQTPVDIHKKNSHASPTPLIARNRLFAHFGHQGTACLKLDGSIVWTNTSLSYPPVHGSGGSPILAGNALIFNCDGAEDPFVAALNRRNGKVLWKTARNTEVEKRFSFSTPLAIQVNGKTQIISPGSGAVCAYDPKTGQELWRVRYGEGYSVVPRPIHGHGLVYVATGFNQATVMAIRPGGSGDVTDTHVAWTVKKSAPLTPSLLLIGNEVYMISDGGIASCLDAKTGETHWQERIGGKYSASPIHAQGRIYCQSEEGDGVILEAGTVFRKLAANPLNEPTLASYAADHNTLYIRAASHLYKVQAASDR